MRQFSGPHLTALAVLVLAAAGAVVVGLAMLLAVQWITGWTERRDPRYGGRALAAHP